jgi:hypothetical protein
LTSKLASIERNINKGLHLVLCCGLPISDIAGL